MTRNEIEWTQAVTQQLSMDIRALLTAMQNDYQAMVRLKNGGVMVTDATEPYSTKGED